MVNSSTTHTYKERGIDMKERKWVDIEGKTEPKKFVPMNESEETPAFKYQQGASARDSLKP